MRKIQVAAALVMSLGLSLVPAAAQPAAKEVTLFWPGGSDPAIQAIVPGLEAKTGYKINLVINEGATVRKQIVAGEPFDVAVLQVPYPDVTASGNIDLKTEKRVSGLVVGVVVKKGAPKPDVSTPDALKKTLLAAKSVAYPDPAGGAAVGVSFQATLDKMGLADQIKAKANLQKNIGGVMQVVAKGDSDIGLAFLSYLVNPGIDGAGILPESVSPRVLLVGYVSTHAKDPAAAQAVLDYLSSPAASAVFVAHNMAPAK